MLVKNLIVALGAAVSALGEVVAVEKNSEVVGPTKETKYAENRDLSTDDGDDDDDDDDEEVDDGWTDEDNEEFAKAEEERQAIKAIQFAPVQKADGSFVVPEGIYGYFWDKLNLKAYLAARVHTNATLADIFAHALWNGKVFTVQTEDVPIELVDHQYVTWDKNSTKIAELLSQINFQKLNSEAADLLKLRFCAKENFIEARLAGDLVSLQMTPYSAGESNWLHPWEGFVEPAEPIKRFEAVPVVDVAEVPARSLVEDVAEVDVTEAPARTLVEEIVVEEVSVTETPVVAADAATETPSMVTEIVANEQRRLGSSSFAVSTGLFLTGLVALVVVLI